ncbi:MAG: alanine racemase [Pseudomonadota bacterium]
MYSPSERSLTASATLDCGALRHNVAALCRHAPAARCMVAVKANAYGHGIERVALALKDQADAFAVARVGEAAALRSAGIDTRTVVLLEGVFDAEEAEVAAALGCQLVVHSRTQLDLLAGAAELPARVWVKVNTGMNRLGFQPADAAALLSTVRAIAPDCDIGLMTHFACADDPGSASYRHQRAAWSALAELEFDAVSLGNSAALIGGEVGDLGAREWVRPGISAYGISPLRGATGADHGLIPVMVFSAGVIAEQQLRPGDAVGYGARFIAERPMRIGVIAAGYGDGYPCQMPDGAPVWVDGAAATVAGRVSMDLTTVDLSALPQSGPGSRVELWGRGLPVERVAAAAKTIPYELVTRVSARVQRHYVA